MSDYVVDGGRSDFEGSMANSCHSIAFLTGFVNAESMNKSLIELRAVADNDVHQFFEHASDLEAVSMAAPARATGSLATFKRQWERIISDEDFDCRSVFLQDELAGYIAKFEQEALLSVSYWFGREFWGQGLARAALSLFLENVVERPLHARVASNNGPSLKVLAANGFTQIGTSSYFSEAIGKEIEEVILRLDA